MTLKRSLLLIFIGIIVTVVAALNMIINNSARLLVPCLNFSIMLYIIGGVGLYKHFKNKA